MCGIAGQMTADLSVPAPGVLARLGRALAHRGPDGEGRMAQPGIALLQTRLAIIDLVTGDQPLYRSDGAALVANGEIYNHVELRAAMRDVAFATGSDCEPILALHGAQAAGFTDHLRGMYALALYDPAERQLTLARDPFGIKPLYYVESDKGLAFASEPQALIAAGLVNPRLRGAAAMELLQLQFTTGRHTVFEGIDRVLPGETLQVVGGRIVARRRQAPWTSLPSPAGPSSPAGPASLTRRASRPRDEAAAVEALDAVLMDAVAVHQRADVPFGMFLSGGVDSSAVLACMARLSDQPVRCYTAGFPGTDEVDERGHAAAVAASVGADHVVVDVTDRDFWSLLPAIAAAVDDPTADYAVVPTYRLAQEAAKDVKVVLSGEGGDELFAGYGRYRSVMRPLLFGGRAMRARGAFDGLGVLRDEGTGWRDGIRAAEARLSQAGGTRLQTAQAVDCADWLPNDLLIKLDRCLMAHGLEGRTPFLDPVVARFAASLPDDLKIRRGVGKYILRRWLDGVMPAAGAFTPKRGFSVPVGAWLGPRAADLAELMARRPVIREFCRPDAVAKLFRAVDADTRKRAARAAWSLLFFALWHRRHVEGLAPRGDVFDCLAD